MAWLVTHMWIWLALAALFGGLIGWALRGRRMQRELNLAVAQRDAALAEVKTLKSSAGVSPETEDRLSKLEVALAAERDTVAALKADLSGAPATDQNDKDDGSLTWRNRYLESRVRYLEGKLADAETAPTGTDADDADIMRLKWRNRYLEGRVKYLEEDTVAAATGAAAVAAPAETAATAASDGDGKPPMLDAPRAEGKDDLKKVGGIGPKIEGILNDLGIFHFDQIAAWSRQHVDWIDGYLSFKGRIDREKWIEQCEALSKGDADTAKTIAKASKKK